VDVFFVAAVGIGVVAFRVGEGVAAFGIGVVVVVVAVAVVSVVVVRDGEGVAVVGIGVVVVVVVVVAVRDGEGVAAAVTGDKDSITASLFSQPAKTTRETIIIAKPDIKDLNIHPTTISRFYFFR
jgi:hypothetical protein